MKKLILSLFLLPALCFGQGAHRVSQVIVKGNGISANVGPGSKILVCVLNTGCATAANIYLDANLTTPAQNPVTADGAGNYDYYIASGCVDEQISSPGQGIIFVPNVCPFNGEGGGGGGGLDPGAQQQVVFYPVTGTTGGPTNITVDVSTKSNLTVPNAVNSLVDNNSWQARDPSIAGMQSTITAAGATGSVVVPANTPKLTIPPTNLSVVSTGGTLGPGTYTYATCLVVGGVQQGCSTGSVLITSGTTNQVQWNSLDGTKNYTFYGRTGSVASIGLLFSYPAHSASDNGSATPGAALVSNITNPNHIMIDDLRYGLISHFATGVPVREFCGIEVENTGMDATDCIQAAINYAISSGIDIVDFTPHANYTVTATRGTVQLAGDDGTCPTGSTVNGAACTPLAPLYTNQAYSLIINGATQLRINFHGAMLVGNYVQTQAASTNLPAMIACVTCSNITFDGGAGITGSTGGIRNSFIAFLVPNITSFSTYEDLSLGPNIGFDMLAHKWDNSRMLHSSFGGAAGIVIGGWYTDRGNTTSPRTSTAVENGGYCDGCNFNDVHYGTGSGFLATHSIVDDYFWNYIYGGPNQGNGRMVDVPGTSSPNGAGSLNSIIPYRGVFGQGLYIGARYGRPSGGPYIVNYVTKAAMRSAINGAGPIQGGFIYGISGEGNGICDDAGHHFVGDPTYCPDPYGTGGLTAAFLNFQNAYNVGTIQSENPGGNTPYVAEIANPSASTNIIDSTNQNQTVTTGSGPAAKGVSPTPGAFKSFVYQDFTPASGGATANVNDTWTLQDLPNYNVAYGGVWDVSHAENPSTGWAFSVPYLRIKSNATTPTCDANSTGYSGHNGWLNYIAGASGVADTLSFCAKDASNTYAWRSLLPTKGRATLVAGTVTVSTAAASTSAIYSLTNCGVGGTQGMLAVSAVVASTSFVINSSNSADTSTVCWVIQ